MKYKFFALLLLWSNLGFAQTGAGGVGNSSNNGLWLKADAITAGSGATVSTWSDASGNGNDANQITSPAANPIFESNSALNNMPVVRFDGIDDEMAVADADILDNSEGVTFYVVLRPNNLDGNPRGILGKRVTYTVLSDYSYTYFFHGGNRLNIDVETQDDRFATGATFSNATNYILGWDFDGTKAAASRSRVRNGSDIIRTSSESSTVIQNSNQPMAIGALNVGYGTYLGADYAEIIQYNYYHNEVENILVNNYLAAKYNIPLTSNDLYDEDDVVNGNYDFDVAGIGQVPGGVNHTEAQGSGIVRVLNPSDLDDNEFLVWGHNNGIQQAVNTGDVPPSIQARFDREWRVSEVNFSRIAVDVGTIDLRFDLTDLGAVTVSDLGLLVDTDNDGLFADEVPITGAVSLGGNIYQFTGVAALANNLRFTLGTMNSAQTILPVEVLNFEAKPVENSYVELNWQTVSEINNDYFTIERSVEGSQWEVVGEVDGKGNSLGLEYYSMEDYNSYKGTSYYRLKQTDFDQQFSYSKIVVVNIDTENFVNIYPNPTSGIATITGNESALEGLIILNTSGQNVTGLTTFQRQGSERISINLANLSSGVYFVKTKNTVNKIYKQ
jgi:hypothetical protein